MSERKSVAERLRELEEKHADAIKEAQSQPGLREMEIVYGPHNAKLTSNHELRPVAEHVSAP